MTIGSTQDRRQFIQDKLTAMAEQDSSDRLAALREIIANGLSFSPVNEAPVKTEGTNLPETGTVIGKLTNYYGPDYAAMHFDLSTGIQTGRVNPRVTLPQIQEANSVVQRYAQEETNPLLIFTLPDDSGLQFVTGNLSPGNPNRLNDILRVSTYWNNQNRTALNCLDQIGDAIARDEVPEDAFRRGLSVQPITQEFFRDYKASYDKTVAKLSETMDKEEAEQFTQTLFNRLLFIHFISKKGWTTWDGNSDYLKALWTDYRNKPEQTNFHSDRLTVLFHEGMNTSEDQRDPTTEDVIGQVPFLNGGLFEKNDLDKREPHVDDVIVSGVIGPGGLFSQYNFTVTEASPLDTEVAVDPEMLGKLFEETVNERHSSGAYYTPRPVVSFMCREALKGYIDNKSIAGLDHDKITELVDGRSPEVITPQQALDVANSVIAIKVVDPACGSGAFLLGMLQEILYVNETLFRARNTSESLYKQKLDIITNNIYGADIDRLAVSTAMLRLWLSLAVDYEGDDIPDPLPNLDMKLVIGDSITGPNPQQIDFTYESISNSNLRKSIAEYTTAQGDRKSGLKGEIGKVKQQLRNELGDAAPEGVVEWRIEFADVMLNGGFNITIANPPYGITVKDKRSALIGNNDSYTNFMALAGDLAPRGILAYITPTSWETGDRFEKFRQYLFRNMALLSVVNLPYDVFDTPYVDTAITIGALGRPQPKEFQLATLEKRAALDLTRISDYVTPVAWESVSGDARLRVPLLDWAANLFARMGNESTPLGNISISKRGIAEYKFEILDKPTSRSLPFYDGQVQRYEVSDPTERKFVIISPHEKNFHHGERLLGRRLVSRSNRLSFARTKNEFVVKEAILPIKPTFNDPTKLLTLLGILNSSLMSFLYLSRSTAAVKDDFRQVTLSGLRELPIVFPDTTDMAELEELVTARERQEGDIEYLEQKIDAVVYRTYGVTDAEQSDIEAWLARSG